jgi:hypothetical protein
MSASQSIQVRFVEDNFAVVGGVDGARQVVSETGVACKNGTTNK